jgi:hypothetical protein
VRSPTLFGALDGVLKEPELVLAPYVEVCVPRSLFKLARYQIWAEAQGARAGSESHFGWGTFLPHMALALTDRYAFITYTYRSKRCIAT